MSVYTEDTKHVYTLLQKVHELEKELDAIHKEIDEKIGKIDLSALATKAELNGLEANVTNLQGQVTAVDSRVDSVGQEISGQVTNLENLSAVTPTEIKSVVGADNIERLYLSHDGEVLAGQDGLVNRITVKSDYLGFKNGLTTYFYKLQNVNMGSEGAGDYYISFYPINPSDPFGGSVFKLGFIDSSTGNFVTDDYHFLTAYRPTYRGLPYFGDNDDLSSLYSYDTNGKSGILAWGTDGNNSGYSIVSGTGIPVFSGTKYSFVRPETMISDYFAKGNTGDGLVRALPSTGKFHPQEPTILFYDGHTGKWSVTSVDSAQEGKDQMLVYNATTHGLEFRPIQ